MNKKQKIALWFGLGLLVLFILCPPGLFGPGPAINPKYRHFVFMGWMRAFQPDMSDLYIRLVVVATVANSLIIVFRDKKSTHAKHKKTVSKQDHAS